MKLLNINLEFLNISNNISNEIFLVYAVIIFIISLIIFIIILEKKEKKRLELTRTKELQLMDVRKADDNYIEKYKKQPSAQETELVEIKQEVRDSEFVIDEEMYIEDDLEKTSAQLQLELLAQELEKAKISEQEKISRFEAEQEENAIISYHELLKVCDELYDKNEKVQYMDEGNEPINLDELRKRFEKTTNTSSNNYISINDTELLD